MGFYVRKSFTFGLLRLNLSRSGLGAFFGVKGARVGIGPRGSYVHMGRGGLYYRQTLTPKPRSTQHGVAAMPQAPPSNNLHEIASASAVTMADSSAAGLLSELNRVKKRRDRFPLVAVLGTTAMGGMWAADTARWFMALTFVAAVVLAVYARNSDVLKGTAILNYSLEPEATQNFAKLQARFRQLSACERIWYVYAAGHNADTKRNAGAATSLKRTEIRPQFSRPPKVQCNLELPTLKAGNTTVYFFPDRLLVYDSGGVGAVAYSDLKLEAQESRFVEDGNVPRDSHQVGTTWQYVNKKGGPDRRFNNNRELPVMQYGAFGFSSTSGLNVLFLCSRSAIPDSFRTAFSQIDDPQPPQAHDTRSEPNKRQVARV
jgi:hypothetical protein